MSVIGKRDQLQAMGATGAVKSVIACACMGLIAGSGTILVIRLWLTLGLFLAPFIAWGWVIAFMAYHKERISFKRYFAVALLSAYSVIQLMVPWAGIGWSIIRLSVMLFLLLPALLLLRFGPTMNQTTESQVR